MFLVLRNMKTGLYCSKDYGFTPYLEKAKIFQGETGFESEDDFQYVSLDDEKRRVSYNEKFGKWQYVNTDEGGEKLRRVKK